MFFVRVQFIASLPLHAIPVMHATILCVTVSPLIAIATICVCVATTTACVPRADPTTAHANATHTAETTHLDAAAVYAIVYVRLLDLYSPSALEKQTD